MLSGHVQVQQDKIDLRLRLEDGEHTREIAGLQQFNIADRIARGLSQRGAEQRVVVGDEQRGHPGRLQVAGHARAVGIEARAVEVGGFDPHRLIARSSRRRQALPCR